MTSGSAGEPRASLPAAPPQSTTKSPAVVLAVASGLFLALFWPILAVRFHYYLETPRYSHCVLLPVVSALWIYDRWDRTRTTPRAASGRGLLFLAACVALFLYGRGLVRNNMLQHVAMLGAVVGAVWALAGRAWLRALAFPISYLVLMIPLPKVWDDPIAQPLQRLATGAAETFFRALGWIVVREGNVLQLPRLKLLVEEGCSGVHSLYALVSLAVAWVFFVDRPVWLRVTLVLASIPIAVIANAVRVAATGVLAYKVDPSYAQGMSHQTAGMIVFVIGMVLTLGLDWCLKPDAAAPERDDVRPA